ncbi:PEGA domain-containing protein [Methanococcus maripaludis]|uniref:PEGA domain-containing protein n=1 Tax=Methanococcus maripaludis TaxID=39152 RepID=A0A7J9PTJ8_METMI|nr:PEGA domain-containing protein [Methanococcus maripaludis]MBA2868897.1 hypothetical protein [Methanococcus maripaludis]
MIKRYILFLLLLIGVIGSVNAVTCTVPETCTPTGYYVILNDPLTTDQTKTMLLTYAFDYYAPVISGINGNIIYLASESDLGRFCTHVKTGGTSNAFLGDYSVFKENKSVKTTVLFGEIYSVGEGTKYNYIDITVPGVTTAYVMASSHCGGSGVSTSATFEGTIITSLSSSGGVYSYAPVVLTGTSNTELRAYSGSSTGAQTYFSICIFGDCSYNQSFTSTQDSSDKYEILLDYTPYGVTEIYTLPDVAIYENNVLIGTTDNGGYISLDLPVGDHDLKVVKEGYWDYLQTVSVNSENNTELFISLSPKTSIFQVSKEFSGNLYPNSVGTLSMDISPMKEAYAAKLRISGVEVNKVYYQTQEVPRSADGYYILGDVTSTQNIEIDFKTPSSRGEKTFTVELSATDIEGTAYTNLETINYEVLELPFLLEMPETFGIGINDITLTDQSGTAYSVLMVLYDSDDVEVWSSSTNLLEYCDYTFEVPVDDAGDYTLELNAKTGIVKTYYSVEIIEPVTLITEEITANPGKIATVQFKISNPTSNVKYYTAELTCPFYNESIAKTFSIAPETVDKTVDISFEVPKELELENYQLSLEIFDPDKTDAIYSGNVVLTISTSSLFLASVPGGNTTLILLAAAVLLIAGTFAALRLKK